MISRLMVLGENTEKLDGMIRRAEWGCNRECAVVEYGWTVIR